MRHKQSAKERSLIKRIWAMLLSILLISNLLIPGHVLAAGMEDESENQTETVELLPQTETIETTAQTDTGFTEETSQTDSAEKETPDTAETEHVTDSSNETTEVSTETTEVSTEATETSSEATEAPTEDTEEPEKAEVVEEDTIYRSSSGSTSVIAYVPAGSFAEPVKLRVVEFSEGSTAYQEAEDALAGTVDYDEMRAFDICFVNGDGIEIEPALPVSISIDTVLDTQEDVAENSVQITHIDDGPQIVAAEMAGTVSVDDTIVSAKFTVESFSTFTLTWNNNSNRSLQITCIDEQGNPIPNGITQLDTKNISQETDVSNIAPQITGYEFSKAVYARSEQRAIRQNATEVTALQYYSGNNYVGWAYRSGGLYRLNSQNNIYFIYTAPIKVYVYVASRDEAGNPMSAEMLELLGINANTIDGNGYFPAGEIYLDRSFLNGKGTAANTPGSPLIQSAADWNAVNSALSDMNTSTLIGQYAANQNNHVPGYLNQAEADIGYSWGSQRTALFRWNDSTSYGFTDQTVKYHLDLRFKTVKIDYIYGNNGITQQIDPNAVDGTNAGTKVFIKGATMDYTPTITAPDGWKIVGYYKDADCTPGQEWNAVDQPINEDTKVYIKIVPKSHVVINYKVQEGQGTVTDPSNNNAKAHTGSENFAPTQDAVATGSTAEPADGWRFEGWYSDEALMQKVSGNENYVPTAPEGGWQEDAEYTYYAKFVRATTSLTIKKVVAGNMGDLTKQFSFSVTGEGISEEFALTNNQEKTIENVPIGAQISISETNGNGYTVSATYGDSPVTVTEGAFTITVEGNKTSIVVTNNREVVPDTGILLDSAPYILLLLALAGVGVAVVLFSRRRKMMQ